MPRFPRKRSYSHWIKRWEMCRNIRMNEAGIVLKHLRTTIIVNGGSGSVDQRVGS